MRAIIIILIVAVVAVLIGVGTGFIDINQTRPARTPDLSTTDNGVVAQGGQTPAFEVETGSVRVGAEDARVKVPRLEVVPPEENVTANSQ